MGMSGLDVLFETEARDVAIAAEKQLIEYYRGRDKCLANINAGGGGLKDKPPFFLYFAFCLDTTFDGVRLKGVGYSRSCEFGFPADDDPCGQV